MGYSWSLMFSESFPPIAAPSARILILGSMPGIASLEAAQYYAHPRNAFWPIVAELFGVDRGLPYAERCRQLKGQGVAVWDVLKSCHREGSLDSAIEKDSEQPNDFAQFFASHPKIDRVGFNGAKAETAFRRHVLPSLPLVERITFVRLPSTSPAHAGRTFELKLADWRAALM